MSDPYLSGDAQLDDYLRLTILLLQRHIARFGYRMLNASGTISDLHVSLKEADAVFERGGYGDGEATVSESLGWPDADVADAAIEAHCAHMSARLEVTPLAQRARLPIESLRTCAGLTEAQVRLLLAAAAGSLSVDVSRVMTFAWADFAIKQPSVGFLSELLADGPSDVRRAHREFRGGGPLVRNRLIELRDVERWGKPTPLLHASVLVPERVLAYLLGHEQSFSGRIFDICTLHTPAEAVPVERLVLRDGVSGAVDSAVERAIADPRNRPRLLLFGPASSGRRTTLHAHLARHGWRLLVADIDKLSQTPERFEDGLAEICREALLQESMLLLRGDELFASRDALIQFNRPLNRLLAPYEGLLAVATRSVSSQLNHLLDDLFEVEFGVPTPPQQRELWARAAEELGVDIESQVPRVLTQRMTVTAGQIYQAVGEARSRQVVREGESARRIELRADDLTKAVRRRADHLLGSIAEPFTTTLTWNDAVLPDKLERRLREILAQARYRERVYDEWGFRRKISYGHGLSCLFSGAPGTGKTMMAAILAKELGRELYRVDLSQIVSKWVGETEKNLGRAFEEAEKGQVILLFDEADALFSKRSSGDSAQDRFANMEVNYLLQRMENYDGMTVLTTNNEQQIDEAFKRRLKFRITFPKPDAEHRAELWRAMLPEEAAVEPDIEFGYLGQVFEMCGGNIRNAVLRAAFYAADDEGVITFDHLYRAALSEAAEMGMVVRDLEGVGY